MKAKTYIYYKSQYHTIDIFYVDLKASTVYMTVNLKHFLVAVELLISRSHGDTDLFKEGQGGESSTLGF